MTLFPPSSAIFRLIWISFADFIQALGIQLGFKCKNNTPHLNRKLIERKINKLTQKQYNFSYSVHKYQRQSDSKKVSSWFSVLLSSIIFKANCFEYKLSNFPTNYSFIICSKSTTCWPLLALFYFSLALERSSFWMRKI